MLNIKVEEIFSINGKTFLITGAYGLIGKSICKYLTDNNATVIAIGRRKKNLEELHYELKDIVTFKVDISKEHEVELFYNDLKKYYSKIDILINNAAKSTSNTFENLSLNEWNEIIATNLGGTFLMCREGVKSELLGENSSIINISSIYGIVAPDQRIYGNTNINSSLVYGVTKAGIIQLTKYLAVYLADKHIRVNSIVLGGIFNNQPSYFLERYINKVPLERMGKVEDIIGAINFLSSNIASNYITGTNIVIDGGFTIW